ncbi:thioesterase [Histoplasma capsulatum var. duboisii H88]|uniref:Thioesterase n=1 Tax=Ajellomyces capsulatus (strain H88) TaxID=544711 RepID=F0UDE8_AJEC8|nr:thioesterase [Histoplasma capsulatum var. duboisii H88]QSS48881.1 thioesterase [Histoplasma capsulatum var. duboisii H88]
MESEDLHKRMKALHQGEKQNDTYKGYNHDLFRNRVRYESVSHGPCPRASFLLTVTEPFCNKVGALHGGCATTLIDVTSTGLLIALSKPGHFSLGGVTRTLNVKFVRPAPMGVEVRIVNELVHAGKRLALVRSEISRVDTGEVCVIGEHDKVNTDPEAGSL